MICVVCRAPMLLDRAYAHAAEAYGITRQRYQCRLCGRDAYDPPAKPERDHRLCLAHERPKPCHDCSRAFRKWTHMERAGLCRVCDKPFVRETNARRVYCSKACYLLANGWQNRVRLKKKRLAAKRMR